MKKKESGGQLLYPAPKMNVIDVELEGCCISTSVAETPQGNGFGFNDEIEG